MKHNILINGEELLVFFGESVFNKIDNNEISISEVISFLESNKDELVQVEKGQEFMLIGDLTIVGIIEENKEGQRIIIEHVVKKVI